MTDHHHHHPGCIIMSYSRTTPAHDLPFWRSTVLHDPPSTLFWIYDALHAPCQSQGVLFSHDAIIIAHHGKTLLEVLARYDQIITIITIVRVHHHVNIPLLPLPMTCHSGEALCSTILHPLSFGLHDMQTCQSQGEHFSHMPSPLLPASQNLT